MFTPSDRQKGMIHNALGLLYSDKPYRRHFVVGRGSPNHDAWVELTVHGFAEEGEHGEDAQQLWFFVSEKGAALLGHKLPVD
ncbi:hypothetical protein CcrBL47_gp309 [Caulobacter phage BL47]|nr:hypothetical protein CcrBL47_gp309 [Caulobacter phage BL47]